MQRGANGANSKIIVDSHASFPVITFVILIQSEPGGFFNTQTRFWWLMNPGMLGYIRTDQRRPATYLYHDLAGTCANLPSRLIMASTMASRLLQRTTVVR